MRGPSWSLGGPCAPLQHCDPVPVSPTVSSATHERRSVFGRAQGGRGLRVPHPPPRPTPFSKRTRVRARVVPDPPVSPRLVILGRASPHLTLPRRAAPPPCRWRPRSEQRPGWEGAGDARARAPESRARRLGLTSPARANPEGAGVGCAGGARRGERRVREGRAAAAPRTAPDGGGGARRRTRLSRVRVARAFRDVGSRGSGVRGARGLPPFPWPRSGRPSREQQRGQVHGEGEAAALPAHVRGQHGRAGPVLEAGAELEGQG